MASLVSRALPLLPCALLACGGGGGTSATAGQTTTSTAGPTTGDPTLDPVTTGLTDMTSGTGSGTLGQTGSTGTTRGVGSTSGSTGGCACAPGEVLGCEGDQLSVCGDDCQPAAQPCPNPGELCQAGACAPPQVCTPGEVVCEGDATKTCTPDGGGFDPPVPCTEGQACADGQCLDPCALVLTQPSSVGCSFFANRMDNYANSDEDSLVVGNTSKTQTATVRLNWIPNGGGAEQMGAPVMVPPGGTHTFALPNPPPSKVSALRKGGAYRVQSDVPIVAYQHSPISAIATNDSSMLLPEHALREHYIVASYTDWLSTVGDLQPSYFNVIAAQDGTTVTWSPPGGTIAGNGVPAVPPGQTGMVTLGRGDLLQVRAADGGDVSGTRVDADKPIWVVGAVTCVNVPSGTTYCDHIEEQMLPLDYWGKTYVGAHSPTRGGEKHYWRVFGGDDGVVVSTSPPQPGTPLTLNKGEWKELVVPNSTSFMFEGTGPFLPVQYLEGTDGGAGTGDPAMYQMIPVEQFLDRYAFVTGQGYTENYVQVIRTKDGPDVLVDGKVVGGYTPVGTYEVADWPISPGGHLAESDAPFGILQIGYTDVTSYAYPGGLQLAEINPQ